MEIEFLNNNAAMTMRDIKQELGALAKLGSRRAKKTLTLFNSENVGKVSAVVNMVLTSPMSTRDAADLLMEQMS